MRTSNAHLVPPAYQRVINPWQTPKEIRLAANFCRRISDSLIHHIQDNGPGTERDWEEWRRVFRLDEPERDWS